MNIKPHYIQDDNLIVRPIETGEYYDPINIDPMLPQHPFLVYCPSVCGSGKSTIIQFLLCTAYNRFFNKIFIISATVKKDVSWKMLKFDEDKVFESYTDGVFRNIVQEIEQSEDQKVLIIIDDMTSQNIWTPKNELCKFIPVHRHSPSKRPPNICGTSLFIISHQYKAIPKSIRGLMSDILIFEMNSAEEVKTISDDNKGLIMTHADFLKLFMMATDEKYSFLYIKKKEPVRTRFRKNFNEIFELEFHDPDGNIIQDDSNSNNNNDKDKDKENEEDLALIESKLRSRKRRAKKTRKNK